VLRAYGFTLKNIRETFEEVSLDSEQKWQGYSKTSSAVSQRTRISALHTFGRDLTKLAAEGKLDLL
jgi:ATP-dependent Clp protease ATP-binding subunit ClpA